MLQSLGLQRVRPGWVTEQRQLSFIRREQAMHLGKTTGQKSKVDVCV